MLQIHMYHGMDIICTHIRNRESKKAYYPTELHFNRLATGRVKGSS